MRILKVLEIFTGAAIAMVILNAMVSQPLQQIQDWLKWRNASWSDSEVAALQSLWIGSLPPLPPDPTNQFSTNERAADLGQKIFFDPRFSRGGRVSCSTCHIVEQMFTDGRALAFGSNIHTRNTPTIIGSAYSPWMFHDGRADSQWAQVLATMENDVEHGGSRGQYALVLYEFYREEYEALFGPMPDLSDPERFPPRAGPVLEEKALHGWQQMTPEDRIIVTEIYVNLSKAVAAYQRLMVPGPSRFDQYVQALLEGNDSARRAALSADEVAGARIFIGQGQCILCHNGPLFTNNTFHNTGTPGVSPGEGRAAAILPLLSSEFNCQGPYSDVADPERCVELRFLKTDGHELLGAFRTPTLRNIQQTAPYFHAGQMETLREVLEFYNQPTPAVEGHNELRPLNLTERELQQLEAFLTTLNGAIDVPSARLSNPHPPSP
jgi:cytochrome c peroxidase